MRALECIAKRVIPRRYHAAAQAVEFRVVEVITSSAAPLTYRGHRYECPVCGMRARAFLLGGLARRPNVICPHCGSAERQRLLWLYLNDKSLLERETRLLHIAPERGLGRRLREHPNVRYLSADLSRLAMMHIDITEMTEFQSGSFDGIIC